ncbi:ACT domain-containing protein [Paraburkholderia terrae]
MFVFASVKDGNAIDPAVIVASIREPEGLSVVTSEADAQVGGLNALFKCAWITLTVNSALEPERIGRVHGSDPGPADHPRVGARLRLHMASSWR